MQIKRLLLQSVLAAGKEPVEIVFSQSNGITYIKGLNLDVTAKSSNGAGKSTIIEGILIGFYGRTLRREDGKPLTMEAMLHDEEDGVQARIELDYDDTRIIRTFTNKKSHVEFWVNDVRKSTDASATQVKKDLQDHININFETMCSILLFGQHHIFSFLEAGESERREVFENLLNLKEYNLYEERAKELRRETRKKIEIFTKSHEITLSHLVSQKAMLEQQKDQFRSYIDGVNRDIARLKRDFVAIPDTANLEKAWAEYSIAEINQKKLKDEKNAVLKHISDISEKLYQNGEEYQKRIKDGRKPFDDVLAMLEKKLTSLETKRDGYQQEIKNKRAAANNITDKIANIDGDYQNRIDAACISPIIFRITCEMRELEIKGKNIKQQIRDIKEKGMAANSTCPICYGIVDPKNAESIIDHLQSELIPLRLAYSKASDELKIYTDARELAISKLKTEWESAKEIVVAEKNAAIALIDEQDREVTRQYDIKLASLEKQFSESKKELEDYLAQQAAEYNLLTSQPFQQRIQYLKDISQLDALIATCCLDQPTTPLSQVGALIAKKESITKEIDDKQSALLKNPYSDIIESLTKSTGEVDAKVTKEAESVREHEALLPYYDFWVDAMGNEGIKSFIIEGILPTLNEQIDYWMQIIYQGAISVKFDKYLNVEIKNNASIKGMKRYGQGSGGERRRIDIAIMLAFRQIMKLSTGKDPNIVFFDEVAENIDEEGLAWLYNVLVDLSKTSRVYVISHNPGLVSLLQGEEILSVVKKNGAMSLL